MKPQPENESAPSGTDAMLADFLEAAFEHYARGERVRVSALLPPALVTEGKQLLNDASDLFAAAVSLHSRLRLLESEWSESKCSPASACLPCGRAKRCRCRWSICSMSPTSLPQA